MTAIAMKTPTIVQRSRRGLTLLETLLAISVGVSFVIGATLIYLNATGRNQVQEAFTQVQTTVAGVRLLYSGSSSYGDDEITEVAVDARIFENKWLVDDQPVNPWGGDIAIEGNERTFTLTYPDVPQDACAQLISLNSTGFGGAVISIEVNGTDIGTQNVDPATATAACDDPNENEIVWEFR
jgi:hypothetical protein